ncbi:hypothetical protein [Nocardia carnea]|uniref:hypothetical protein n=1 Tax=Nocardia carnea TaxID=37328 RepID=UPI0024589D5E|nr:hypothetical protein [Nocardia carnea]
MTATEKTSHQPSDSLIPWIRRIHAIISSTGTEECEDVATVLKEFDAARTARIAELEFERDMANLTLARVGDELGCSRDQLDLWFAKGLRDRAEKLEAARRPSLGYVVGWQGPGRTFLVFDEPEVGIIGDRVRAYTDPEDAYQFRATCERADPTNQFHVYTLQED